MLRFSGFNIIVGLALVVLLLADVRFGLSSWWYVALICCYVVTVLFFSWYFRGNFFVNAIHANPNVKKKHISLTFDDGPHPEHTLKTLALLRKFSQKATFFVIGKNADKNADIVKQILADGHTIGNHSHGHSQIIGFYPTKKVISEIEQTNKILREQTGKHTLLYRPPFGVTNPNIAKAITKTNMQAIGWNTRSLDTLKISEGTIYKRITRNLKPGDVVLLHDTSEKTLRVLERLLVTMKKKDITSVTINELFNIKAYA